jgi:hypothetical protein
MENDEHQRRLLEAAQALALRALDLAPCQRQEFIERAVAAIHRSFVQKHGTQPGAAETAARLQAMTEAVMQVLEEDGGQIGHA